MAATTASSFSVLSHIRARSPQSTVQAAVMLDSGFHGLRTRNMLDSGFHGLRTRNLISKTAGSSLTQSLCKQSYEIELINGWQATTNPSYKVTIIGSPLGMGLALSTAQKNCPSVSQLQFYSIGGQDHLNACIYGTHSPDLKGVLNGVDVVIICPVMPVEESALLEDDFIANATIVKACIEAVASHCPNAFIAISSRFLNSIIPMAAEILKKRAIYDPNKVFGLMTPEVELARAFVAERLALDAEDVHVPVIGGHCEDTTLPLFSKTNPRVILYEGDRNMKLPDNTSSDIGTFKGWINAKASSCWIVDPNEKGKKICVILHEKQGLVDLGLTYADDVHDLYIRVDPTELGYFLPPSVWEALKF